MFVCVCSTSTTGILVIKFILVLVSVTFFQHSFLHYLVLVTGDIIVSFFTALHGMQTQSSDENSVRLSVRLSNARSLTKLKKDRSRFSCHTKDHLA